jgi:hypothetical protein
VEHLAGVYFDHSLLLLCLCDDDVDWPKRLFRFYASWATHSFFKGLVRKTQDKPAMGFLDNIPI